MFWLSLMVVIVNLYLLYILRVYLGIINNEGKI